jgi:malate dehydrogenase
MAVSSDGSYGAPEGIYCSFPVTTGQGGYEVVPNLDINDFSRRQVDRSTAELVEERDSVASLGLLA